MAIDGIQLIVCHSFITYTSNTKKFYKSLNTEIKLQISSLFQKISEIWSKFSQDTIFPGPCKYTFDTGTQVTD